MSLRRGLKQLPRPRFCPHQFNPHKGREQGLCQQHKLSNSFMLATRPLTSISRPVVDLRSDTVTSPTSAMLQSALHAPLGDDVMGEDPTVLELEEYTANLFGKEAGLYLPTGTMANIVAVMAHCHGRASEMIIGTNSHLCLYEGGNAAGLAGVHTRQLREDPCTAQLSISEILDAVRQDNDDHYPHTKLICLENTHNMLGGVVLTQDYVDKIGNTIARGTLKGEVKVHMDGARFMNAFIASRSASDDPSGCTSATMCRYVDSISLCLSKGLGAPLGSVLVGQAEMIRLAKRARKRCGGGMRQAGVVAAMGKYALEHHVERLAQDHGNAQRLARELMSNGFQVSRGGKVDTNLVFFALPEEGCRVGKEEFCARLEREHGVKLTGGYCQGGEMFRACTHMDVDEEGIDRAIEGILNVCFES